MREHSRFDVDAGLVVGLVAALYVMAVGGVRGLLPGRISPLEFGLLVAGFTTFTMIVGAIIAARPDFGRTRRAALIRGFIATAPIYAAGGILFLPPEQWAVLLPFFSFAPAALVGPPIGIFMYRLYRRPRDGAMPPGVRGWLRERETLRRASGDPSVDLAWQKGELLGSWTPMLITVALFASFGLGTLAIEMADLEFTGFRLSRPSPTPAPDSLTLLYEAVRRNAEDPRARFRVGVVLTSLGRFDEAVKELTLAARLDSSQVDHWRMLGRAAFYAENRDLALEAYWNAQRLDPSIIPLRGLDRAIWGSLLDPGG